PALPIQLAVSRDSRRWTRVANRIPFIEGPAPGAWDAGEGSHYDTVKVSGEVQGFIRPAAGLFIHEDQVRMYYSNTSGKDVLGGVGMATWRRDGFVSLHGGSA